MLNEKCEVGNISCPNWQLWTDEIGSIIAHLDERIADVSQSIIDESENPDTDSEAIIKFYEGKIAAYEELREQL